jgi:hypothetical protein
MTSLQIRTTFAETLKLKNLFSIELLGFWGFGVLGFWVRASGTQGLFS